MITNENLFFVPLNNLPIINVDMYRPILVINIVLIRHLCKLFPNKNKTLQLNLDR